MEHIRFFLAMISMEKNFPDKKFQMNIGNEKGERGAVSPRHI